MTELAVVGCSGSGPGPTSAASCYLVRTTAAGTTTTVLLDLGSGAFGALLGMIDPRTVDAIVLSHLHADHCLDMCAWDVAAAHSATAPWPPVATYAPAGAYERLARAAEVDDPAEAELARSFDFRVPAEGTSVRVGPLEVRLARVDHPVEAYAVRVDAPDGTLVYSGDTGPCAALTELARGADVLVAEATFADPIDTPGAPAPPAGLHLTGRQAGECAAAAGVGTLVLTHVPAWEEPGARAAEAGRVFTGRIVLARPGLRVPVGAGRPE